VVRTQIQLTMEQAAQLKRLAASTGRSMADLVREGVERLLRDQAELSRPERMRRAARVFGTFKSGTRDLSNRHDDHFADAAEPRR
jgi:predicted DNA-binding protein